MDRIAKRALVRGVVQGVGFRWSTRERARELGVLGWVRNLADGGVEVWAEGPPSAVDEIVTWLAHGPRGASLAVEDASPSGAERFEVRR